MRNLKGKIAVVTGAGSGIGRAIAMALARAGVTVAVADIDPVSAKAAAADIGGAASAHPVDVSSETEVRALRSDVLEIHGHVDILVNNAGVGHAPATFVATTLADVRRILEINLMGAVHGTAVFLPDLLPRPEAALVNMGSYTGLLGMPSMVPYSTSKFAVRGFTESLRMELGGTSVAVTLVMPGATRSSFMLNSPVIDPDRRAALQKVFDDSPALSAEVVAAKVVKAILKGSPRVLTGKDTRALDLIVRTLPGRYSALLAKPMNSVLKKTFG